MIGMTVCSGIGAPELSAPWIDWRYQSEIEPFPCAVLAHRFPDAVNLGDMSKFKEWPDANVDVLCGGTPCQSFSVAGLRKGLDDPRGNLMLTYLAIARRYRPRWLVWENVPGVLSSNGGRDFGSLLWGMGELGYGFAYRVLDAQYVRTRNFPRAVPQRRRRVFVVAYLGDWRRAAAVLFDGESLSGNSPPRREAGKAAPTIPSRSTGGGGLGTDFDCDGGLIANPVAPTLNAHFGDKMGLENQHINGGCGLFVAHSLRGEGFDASEDGTGRGVPLVPVGVALRGREGGGTAELTGPVSNALRASQGGGDKPHVMAFSCKDYGADATDEVAPTMRAMGHGESHANAGGQVAVAFHQKEGLAYGDATEADASSALSFLREEVGEEAYREWGLRVLAALQPPEVLQSWLHGEGLFRQGEDEHELERVAPECPDRLQRIRMLRALWVYGPNGRSPQGRGLAKQLAGEPGEALSVLPHEGASQTCDLPCLREAREGARLLREALSALQALGRPDGRKGEPEHTPWAVRRLTPVECARLQGFPDDWCRIPWRGKPAEQCPDGPQYKALGNSWARNCGEWIFDGIRRVEATA